MPDVVLRYPKIHLPTHRIKQKSTHSGIHKQSTLPNLNCMWIKISKTKLQNLSIVERGCKSQYVLESWSIQKTMSTPSKCSFCAKQRSIIFKCIKPSCFRTCFNLFYSIKDLELCHHDCKWEFTIRFDQRKSPCVLLFGENSKERFLCSIWPLNMDNYFLAEGNPVNCKNIFNKIIIISKIQIS